MVRNDEEDSKMPRVKASKQKRVTKAVPALGAAGLTFSLVGGASAAVAPANNESQTTKYSPNHQLTLGEEEMADVSLATFYVFDKEAAEAARNGVQLARGCGCGGRGCGGGCRGRGGRGWGRRCPGLRGRGLRSPRVRLRRMRMRRRLLLGRLLLLRVLGRLPL